MMLVSLPVYAQLQSLKEFEDVNIPFNLKYEDLIFKAGKYDFEFFTHGVGQVF